MKIRDLKKKKILILGFGKEGQDNYLALRKLFPAQALAVADRLDFRNLLARWQKILSQDKNLKLHFGAHYLKNLKNYNLILRTPGIPDNAFKPFLKKGARVTSQTELFFAHFDGLIIGITGTKGKGTTASLIYHILKKAKLKVRFGGNIGDPVLQTLLKSKKDEIFVYELSSHQLQGLKKSPQIAVFLNLFPDHLDYYKNFQEYKKAKENIAKHQKVGDWFIFNADDKIARRIAQKTPGKKIPFSLQPLITYYTRSLNSCYQGFVKNGWVYYGKEKIISKKEIPLKGDFNLLNVMAAVAVARILKVPNKTLKQALRSFKPLPHRLEYVGKYKGIEFYNDSMSTLPEVTIGALQALGEKVKTLIVGGSEKGSDYSDLAKKILASKIRNLIIFRQSTGEKVWREIKNQKSKQAILPFFAGSMREAVKIAYQQTKQGEICLLSPGAASFNLFRDYKERGNLFKRYVNGVKRYGSEKKHTT